MPLELKQDNIGISPKIYNYEDNWKTVYSIKRAENVIYISNGEGINLIDCAATTVMKTVKNDSSFSAYKLSLYKSGVLLLVPVHRKINHRTIIS